MAFAQCALVNIVVGLLEGQNQRVVNTPGDRSLTAIVRSATLDPARSIREFRAEAVRAQQACATADEFTAQQLRARALRCARAAEVVEAKCAVCSAPCVVPSFDADPGDSQRPYAPDPPH